MQAFARIIRNDADMRHALQMKLPGPASVRAKIGVHSGEASDSLVGCSSTLHYRSAPQSHH